MTLLSSDADVIQSSDYVLSIVPPRDAVVTARRVAEAFTSDIRSKAGRTQPLYFLDLNAIAPSTTRSIGELFRKHGEGLRYVDGGIIGGPPRPHPKDSNTEGAEQGNGQAEPGSSWARPSIVLSGPHPLSAAPVSGEHLAQVLRGRHVGDEVGTASGLKCCFASLTKGFTALAIQSFSTASRLGVMGELQEHLGEFAPAMKTQAERGVVGMPPKAYRWVDEMREIGRAFAEDGGWTRQEEIYGAVGEIYKFVAEDTVLGVEKTDDRTRKTIDSVVDGLKEGLETRSKKTS